VTRQTGKHEVAYEDDRLEGDHDVAKKRRFMAVPTQQSHTQDDEHDSQGNR